MNDALRNPILGTYRADLFLRDEKEKFTQQCWVVRIKHHAVADGRGLHSSLLLRPERGKPPNLCLSGGQVRRVAASALAARGVFLVELGLLGLECLFLLLVGSEMFLEVVEMTLRLRNARSSRLTAP